MVSHSINANAHGPYLGMGIGYGNGSSKITTDYSELVTSDSLKKNDMAVKGFQGALYAGFGRSFMQNSYYAGLETSMDLNNAKGQDKQTVGCTIALTAMRNDVSLKYKRSFNAAFKGGVYLGEKSLLYVKPGISLANWRYSSHYNQGGSANKSSYLIGVRISIGLQYTFASNTDIGVEYNYSKYKDFKLVQALNSGEIIRHRIKPTMNSCMVNLVRRF
jgi:opacity protein-like surface antigen